MAELKLGKYRHYKGNLYQVVGIGRHSETLEKLVIYKPLYDSKETEDLTLWVRPYEMFNESVEYKGKTIPRFEYLE